MGVKSNTKGKDKKGSHKKKGKGKTPDFFDKDEGFFSKKAGAKRDKDIKKTFKDVKKEGQGAFKFVKKESKSGLSFLGGGAKDAFKTVTGGVTDISKGVIGDKGITGLASELSGPLMIAGVAVVALGGAYVVYKLVPKAKETQ